MHRGPLSADTCGIGELISRKKRLLVPSHQRDFAWTTTEVDQYLDDVIGAVQRGATDYFLGLLVVVGPIDGAWRVLDGQQRLATTTMLFGAIRHWLAESGLQEDAQQIEGEFIAVRQLGTSTQARLTLNRANRDIFEAIVIQDASDAQIDASLTKVEPYSSNFWLAQAVRRCRVKLHDFASTAGHDIQSQVSKVYQLHAFLETQVQVVCLEVPTEADAFLIFESLNYRGNDLSALDLVKNHLYRSVLPRDHERVGEYWSRMFDTLVERDANDFLKILWTAEFGRVQRGELFRAIQSEYHRPEAALRFAALLADSADFYAALDDPEHVHWRDYGAAPSHYVAALDILHGKQVRPVIFSALKRQVSAPQMGALLWELLVLTLRYQVVGRRRTGALEIACAQIARDLSRDADGTVEKSLQSIRTLAPPTQDFAGDFRRYTEILSSRALYVLCSIEVAVQGHGGYDATQVAKMLQPDSGATVASLVDKARGDPLDLLGDEDFRIQQQRLRRLGNRFLWDGGTLPHASVAEDRIGWMHALESSRFETTRWLGAALRQSASSQTLWVAAGIDDYQSRLADIAGQVWSFGG